jgi:simple sugar transport system permease protein
LAIAIVIFALWKPKMAILSSYIFGGLYIASVYIPGLSGSTKELIKMLPYLVTIVVLVFTSSRKKKEHQPPQSLGLSYFREER